MKKSVEMNVKSDIVLARLSKNPVRCGDKTTGE